MQKKKIIPSTEKREILKALGCNDSEIKEILKREAERDVYKCPLCGEEPDFRDWQTTFSDHIIYRDYICCKCGIGYYVYFEATEVEPYSEEREKELREHLNHGE